MALWKGKVDEQVVQMFLDKIFELCRCSVYDFERYLLDVACGSVDIPKLGDVCESCKEECHEDCDWCDDLEERLNRTKDLINSLKHERDQEKEKKECAKAERDQAVVKYNALKENAVLFSPDDLKDILPEYEQRLDSDVWRDDDDEIPF